MQYSIYAIHEFGRTEWVRDTASEIAARLIAMKRSTRHPLHCIVFSHNAGETFMRHFRNGRLIPGDLVL